MGANILELGLDFDSINEATPVTVMLPWKSITETVITESTMIGQLAYSRSGSGTPMLDILDLVHHPIDGKYIVVVLKVIDFDLVAQLD